MKVFVLCSQYHEDFNVLNVYLHEEDANNALLLMPADNDDYFIEERLLLERLIIPWGFEEGSVYKVSMTQFNIGQKVSIRNELRGSINRYRHPTNVVITEELSYYRRIVVESPISVKHATEAAEKFWQETFKGNESLRDIRGVTR